MANLPTPQPSERILKYEQLGMGLYVHWGLFSQLEKGEWAYERAKTAGKTTPEEYKKLMDTFTAEDFDADLIVKGLPAIKARIHEIESLGNDATAKEKEEFYTLENNKARSEDIKEIETLLEDVVKTEQDITQNIEENVKE